ncbi:MAG: DegV family protein [Eubacteriales bacterium]|nr:DegV family protein [Eubacteriales bacterium]
MYEILADVAVDIDRQAAANEKIKYVPMEYIIGSETRYCVEPESLETMHKYYDSLRQKVETKTSQITPYQYAECFKPYVKEHIGIMYIALSTGLSDTYHSANMAVKMLKEEYTDVNIEIIDSLSATGGMGLLTESACENRRNGMSLTENAQWIREHRKDLNVKFIVDDLMYLKRGGRISPSTAIVGSALNIKPVLQINKEGKLDTIAKKRGKKIAMKYLVDDFEQTYDPSIGNVVYIDGADCMADEEILKKMILDKFPDAQVRLTSLSPIIGAHTGPDMISLIHYGMNW